MIGAIFLLAWYTIWAQSPSQESQQIQPPLRFSLPGCNILEQNCTELVYGVQESPEDYTQAPAQSPPMQINFSFVLPKFDFKIDNFSDQTIEFVEPISENFSNEKHEFVQSATLENFGAEVRDFIELKKDIIGIMAREAELAFKLRVKLINNCSCVPNRCSNILGPDATCGLDLGNAEECDGREGTMYSMQRGMAGMPLVDQFPGNLSSGLKASICLMNHLETQAVPQLIQKNITTWAYIGTEAGAIWSFPGRLRRRNNETGVAQWNYCNAYDPRTRPWYHAGAGGPLDIVVVVDILESMVNSVVGQLTRWDIVQSALKKFVKTITFTDSFNIVFFNFKGESLSKGLLRGTAENKQKAVDMIQEMFPSGGTNFEAAFETAFSALNKGFIGGNSTNCNQVILFLTDGKDDKIDPLSNLNKNRTADILNKVDKLQNELYDETGKRVSIFSFSIGESADDSIPRQLACRHNGSWAPIAAQDDPLTVFNTFLRFVASARTERNTERIYWSEVTEDAAGLGEEFSAVIPVYTPPNDFGIPGALFGVVAHDILVNDLRDLAGNQTDQLIEELQKDSKTCDEFSINTCLQQVLRGKEVECADLSYQSATCTKFDDRYYYRSNSMVSWSEAKDQCEEAGGKLAVPNIENEQAFLAGVASFQGSWIGLSQNESKWVWEHPQIFMPQNEIWAYGQGNFVSGENQWGTMAPSGTQKNIYTHACRSQFNFICEFQIFPDVCNGTLLQIDSSYEYVMPRIEQCSSAESLKSLRFFEEVDLSEILPEKLFCLDDFSQPSMTENFEELFCCPEK